MNIFQNMEKKRASIIIIIIIIGIVVFCGLWIVGGLQTHQKNYNEEEIENMTQEQLPEDVKKEIETIKLGRNRTFGISRWEFNFKNNQVVIYVFNIRDEKEVNALQGKHINNWTINVVHDVDYEKERNQAWAEFIELEKDPELQIAGFDMSAKDVNMWVYNLTPENQALDGKVIHGRTIHIYIALTPTPTATKG